MPPNKPQIGGHGYGFFERYVTMLPPGDPWILHVRLPQEHLEAFLELVREKGLPAEPVDDQ